MSVFSLYDNVWTEAMDAKLMELVITESDSKGNPKGIPKTWDFVVSVKGKINAQFNMTKDVHFYILKLEYLEERYHLWVSLLREQGVFWDKFTNILRATDETWRSIQEVRSAAMVYRNRGEPHYAALAKLFHDKVFEYLDYEDESPCSDDSD
ncbi:uncharacterized protein LOC131002798 [Salvia miltiorrhiza]|uniref:uncharacterized protein LOC131002798 n=1 Tax=Salvia miltiorrhiza TaxID=226208 RepID=UPI0025AC60F3|nr:uncharacterized protein LOC131002798 [Salvia miltiorrhiza]